MNDTPETTEAFAAALETLIQQAADAGVTVTGGWDCRAAGDAPDWDVVITEVDRE